MLAEKYRPRDFSQVIGQQKVIDAICWYLGRPSDSGLAFLLTGPSGSGKTTIAECAARHWGCTDLDIHRIESAECDVARLRELADSLPIYGWGKCSHKCYIIDEVHTISGRAADRLLSLLENLPKHVLLVATTTEVDWCANTLFSRWVKLPLAKVRSCDVAEHLERVAREEDLPIPSDPAWAAKMVKYQGLNIRDLLNQLPAYLLAGVG